MSTQLRGLCEAPLAPLALEGLFSSVRPDVVVERGGPSKRTTTVATLERSVTGVSDHVIPQF